MNSNQIKLPVEIIAGYTSTSSARDQAIQKIEKTALYIESIFNMIRISAEKLEDSEDYQIQTLGGDLQHLSEIGYGVAGSLSRSVMVFHQDEPARAAGGEKELGSNDPAAIDDQSEDETIEDLAAGLSRILRSSKLPVTIYNQLMHTIDDIYHESESDALSEYQTSSGFLRLVIADYAERETEARNGK